jgi:hypothetical protein
MRLFLAPLAFALAVCASAHADGFLKGIPDVPLMTGLVEAPEPVVFESDKGRVMKTAAEGKTSRAAVQFFYMQSLPQLGWKRTFPEWESLAFQREADQLKISIAEDGKGGAKVTFELVAKLASINLPE